MLAIAERLTWFRMALQVRGSVVPMVLPRVLLLGSFGAAIAYLDFWGIPVAVQALSDLTGNVVFNFVLGLLLVFRTNTAYDRYWEGRKAWGVLVVNIRNLAREIRVGIAEATPQDAAEKMLALKLLQAFAIATKLHLRQEDSNEELAPLLSAAQRVKLDHAKNRPLEILLWIRDYLQQQHQRGIDTQQLLALSEFINQMVEGLTGCERILKTPIPIAYAIYLKRLILIYCLALPFGVVTRLHGWTGLLVAIVSFILLGIEEIGNEIEDPFGPDPNDLPIDDICQTIVNNVEEVSTFLPGDWHLNSGLQQF